MLVHLCGLISRRRLSPSLAPLPPLTQEASPESPCWLTRAGSRATETEGWGPASSSLRLWLSFHYLSCSPLGTAGLISYDSKNRKVVRGGPVSVVLHSDGHCLPAVISHHPLTRAHSGDGPGLVLGSRNACGHAWPHDEWETAEPDLRENCPLCPRVLPSTGGA